MSTRALITSVAVLFLATGTAHARPSYPSTEWVKECSTPAKTVGDNVLTCQAYIHGLINALAIWQYMSPETAVVCIPADVDFGKMRDQILPQARKEAHPNTSASMLITRILSEQFPCGVKS
jgi:Rap1a immunity proteins